MSNESFAFRVRSLMGLASVILFCTVNRSSVWQEVCVFSSDLQTVDMMPVLLFILHMLICGDCIDMNA